MAHLTALTESILGARVRSLGDGLASIQGTTVTWCDTCWRLTVGFLVVRWGLGWPSIGVSA